MTDPTLPLAELLAKAGEGDFLRAVAEFVVQLLMEADVEGMIGAGRHERTPDRQTYRNGFRDRALDTRLGTLQLRIPKLRQGSYFLSFLDARKTSEKALVAVIQEAWIGGVSTRRVDELVQAMGLSGISKSTVSKLCKDIDERVNAFLDRPLTGGWPYLWLDATDLRQREGGRIVSGAAIIAGAVDDEGRREIVGLHIGPSEAETFWSTFLERLVKRGLGSVKLVISDAHESLKGAIRRVMGTTAIWQRCSVHWLRNALAYVPKAQQTMVAAGLRQALLQPDQEGAHRVWRAAGDQFRILREGIRRRPRIDQVEMAFHWLLSSDERLSGHFSPTAEGLNPSCGCRSPSLRISQARVGVLANLAAERIFSPPGEDGEIEVCRATRDGVNIVAVTSPGFQEVRIGDFEVSVSTSALDAMTASRAAAGVTRRAGSWSGHGTGSETRSTSSQPSTRRRTASQGGRASCAASTACTRRWTTSSGKPPAISPTSASGTAIRRDTGPRPAATGIAPF